MWQNPHGVADRTRESGNRLGDEDLGAVVARSDVSRVDVDRVDQGVLIVHAADHGLNHHLVGREAAKKHRGRQT